ncbi:MAG: mannose-6-phosphate isomerase, class I [Acidobacteriota bacterium]
MRSIFRLRNPIQDYAWGSPTAIPELLGQPATGEPQAELWMGDHPRAPSAIEIDGAWRPLDAVMRERGDLLLGAVGRQLPFLFKVLAAETALSIQAHPEARDAAAGFAREEAAGIPRDAAERSYRDANAKPEILLALTPFRILRGFRPPGVIARRAAAVGLGVELPEVAGLATPGGLERFVHAALSLEGAQLARVLDRVLERSHEVASSSSEESSSEAPSTDDLDASSAREMLRLAAQYPDDRGVLGPLYLELFDLPPGEAVFTGPAVLHAYLGGLGVELMANSDNVLRGGLTAKHVDAAELTSVLRYEPNAPRLLAPRLEAGGTARRFEAPEAGLVLSDLRLRPGNPLREGGAGVRILLCVEGSARIAVDGLGDDSGLEIARGQSVLVADSAPSYTLEGAGRLFCAEVR